LKHEILPSDIQELAHVKGYLRAIQDLLDEDFYTEVEELDDE